jgi:DNA replication and repair protein RecF
VQLTRLRLFQYRNIEELEVFPSRDTTLLRGRNGQGKTNLLEAIYFLGYGRSFRTATPRDCIQHGRAEALIEGTVEHGSITREIQVSITGSDKKLFLLGKHVPVDEFVGVFHVLAFTHEHLKVVRGGPADRRAFLDRAMVTLYPGHLKSLAEYGRALKQRNSILSAAREGGRRCDEQLLESWDETIIGAGARIVRNRLSYVEKMKQALIPDLFGSEILKIYYHSTIVESEIEIPQIEARFREKLLQLRSYDRRTGFTSVGPHRDDLKLFVNGKSLVDFGSAGQQRSGLLALYFSQMEIHRNFLGFYPVFLVDDAEAELDQERLSAFLQYLARRTQTFLSSAKDFFLSDMTGDVHRFEIQNGRISDRSEPRP